MLITMSSTAKALLAAYVPRVLGESRMRVYVNPLLRYFNQLAAKARWCKDVEGYLCSVQGRRGALPNHRYRALHHFTELLAR